MNPRYCFEHVTSNAVSFTFKQNAKSVPLGLRTLILDATMLLHTDELEQAKGAISGWYFFVVTPLKFLKTISVIVRGDGYSKHKVKFDCP